MTDDEPPRPPKPRKPARPYEVGYGKPPIHARFKPGQSGNPSGRPRKRAGDFSIETTLLEQLRTRVTLIEKGRRRRVSKAQALITALVNAALKNDARAMRELLRLWRSSPPQVGDHDPHGAPVDHGAEVRAKLEALVRYHEQKKGNDEEGER